MKRELQQLQALQHLVPQLPFSKTNDAVSSGAAEAKIIQGETPARRSPTHVRAA